MRLLAALILVSLAAGHVVSVEAAGGNAAAPPSKPKVVEPKIEQKGGHEKSSSGSTEESSTPPNSTRSDFSALTKKALTGRLTEKRDVMSAYLVARQTLEAHFRSVNEDRSYPPRLAIPLDKYFALVGKKSKEAWTDELRSDLWRQAGDRGLVMLSAPDWGRDSIIAGAWSQGPPAFAFIESAHVAAASLYLPYFVGLHGIQKQGAPVSRSTAPILAINEDLFATSGEKKGDPGYPVHHRELLIDPRVDIRGYWTLPDGTYRQRVLESRPLLFSAKEQPQPATMARLLGCCVYVRPPGYADRFIKFLKAIRLDVQQVRVAVMVHDSATRQELARDSFLSAKARSASIGKADVDVEGWVTSQIEAARGGTLLLLAHVEGSDYVVRRPDGSEAGRVGVDRANELALRGGVTLFNLGCKTADALREFDGVGVLESFNSIRMLRTVSKALRSGPKTMAEFLERLGTPEASIVIPSKLMSQPEAWAQLKGTFDEHGKSIVQGERMRLPAIRPVLTPEYYSDGLHAGISVALMADRPTAAGHYPVVAELRVTPSACASLKAMKEVWESIPSDRSCELHMRGDFAKARLTLFGQPERTLR